MADFPRMELRTLVNPRSSWMPLGSPGAAFRPKIQAEATATAGISPSQIRYGPFGCESKPDHAGDAVALLPSSFPSVSICR